MGQKREEWIGGDSIYQAPVSQVRQLKGSSLALSGAERKAEYGEEEHLCRFVFHFLATRASPPNARTLRAAIGSLSNQNQFARLSKIASGQSIEIDSACKTRSVKLRLVDSRCFSFIHKDGYLAAENIVHT